MFAAGGRSMDADLRLSIGALSEQTAVNIETIRFYERLGILPAPPRSAGGHRLYNNVHKRRLIFIRRAVIWVSTSRRFACLSGLVVANMLLAPT